MFGRGLACTSFALFSAWKFTIVFLGIWPLVVISLGLMIKIIKKYTALEFKAYGNAGSIAQEALSSIRTVLSLGIQKKAINDYELNLKSAEQLSIKKGLLKGFFEGLSGGLFNCYFGIAIYYATYLESVDSINYNTGTLIAAFFCLVASTFSIGAAGPYFGDVAVSKGAAKQIFDLIETESKIDSSKSNGKKIENFNGEIEFQNVNFNYPQRPDFKVLFDFSLKIAAGKTIAFCGKSGSGKSTIVSLLQRFYLPNSGSIKIDNESIENINLEWLRNQMALVSQEPILFTTTIKENIRLGRLDATDVEIEQAAKMANAHDFIMQTEQKYETLVGEKGTQLSGGQRQRIAIARALLRNPKILLLDEATSALDNESEKIVQDALDKAKIGRTTLIIAHRLSTIRNADLIVGLDEGKIKEVGTHDQLMEMKGLYCDLVMSQTKETQLNKQEKNTELESEFESESENEQDKLINNDLKLNRISSVKKTSKTEYELLKKEKKSKNIFHYDFKVWKMQRSELIWILIGVLSQLGVGFIFPLISLVFSQIYSIFSIKDLNEKYSKSFQMMIIIFGLGILNFLFTFFLNYALSVSGAKLTKKIRVKMFESMLRQEISFHDMDQNRSSILTSQLAYNAPLLRGLTSDKLGLLCQGFR